MLGTLAFSSLRLLDPCKDHSITGEGGLVAAAWLLKFPTIACSMHTHLTLQRTAIRVFTHPLPQVGFEGRLCPKAAGCPASSLHCCGSLQFRAPPGRWGR